MRTFEQLRREVAKAGPHGTFRLKDAGPEDRRHLDRFCHLAAVEPGNVSVFRVDHPTGLQSIPHWMRAPG